MAGGLVAERVGDYPRPPRLERVPQTIRIRFDGVEIAATGDALRVLETTHPPTYYLPRSAFLDGVLVPTSRGSFCEWKGRARYWDIRHGARIAADAAWGYDDPSPPFGAIAGHVAVYCAAMESCLVGDEQATPQPGGFYGGWVTSNLIGPFKGAPGTMHW